jgi:hypothetical protein
VTFTLSRRLLVPAAALLVAALALALAACGSSQEDHNSATLKFPVTIGSQLIASKGDCAHVAAATLGEVGERIYEESSHGANVGEALGRVRASSALASAISTENAAATRAALDGLLANQIARIAIVVHGKVLASAGSGAAIAPVRGSIPGTGASFVLSTQSAQSYLSVTRQVTGAEVLLYGASGRLAGTVGSSRAAGTAADAAPHEGAVTYAGGHYQAHSIAGAAYPSGPLRIVLLVPRSAIRCPKRLADTKLDTLGRVGERIYEEEAGSPYVQATLRHIEADESFQRAVAARDTRAIRAAIVGLFAAHIHVVRVRVYASEPSGAQRFLYDLGGPYVLAPVHGLVRSAGKLVGRFSFAIQDDAGYMKLAQRFTGADVLMRVGPSGEKQVIGTLDPGPTRVPDRGTLGYRGESFEAYSFTGIAFPSGPLRISLLYRTAGS